MRKKCCRIQILFYSYATKGRIVKTGGESVMGTFTTGEAAVKAFVEVLDSLKGRIFPSVSKGPYGLHPILLGSH
jgi:hypothetical protein